MGLAEKPDLKVQSISPGNWYKQVSFSPIFATGLPKTISWCKLPVLNKMKSRNHGYMIVGQRPPRKFYPRNFSVRYSEFPLPVKGYLGGYK